MNFYPRPPRGGRLTMQEYYNKEEQFLSTPSARRATASSGRPAKTTAYFYPRPPRGGRRISFIMSRLFLKFLSTPSARRATGIRLGYKATVKFLSTPSARRATGAHRHSGRYDSISIHALREEGDRQTDESQNQALDFYPRPPRGGRPGTSIPRSSCMIFLSTPSARRATPAYVIR